MDNTIEASSIKNEETTFNYVNNCLVKKFYEFMADIYIEHQQLKKEQEETMKTEQIFKPLQEFSQYFLYKLFYNYGVKRRMANNHIALLYYSKTAKGYKNTEPITMLCRHMLLDLRFMRIISLGIPKAIKLDQFCSMNIIDKTNSETNNNIVNDIKNEKYDMYYFTEGTMMTYNPSLVKYNITVVDYDSDDDYDMEELNTEFKEKEKEKTKTKTKTIKKVESKTVSLDDTKMDISDISDLTASLEIDKPTEIKFNNQFMYSTRKILGTGKFSSSKSFLEMFTENNKINKIDLEKIPEALSKDTVLVFNIEHPDNNIISTIKRNSNMLCAVFKFKNEEDSTTEYNSIMSINYSKENEETIKLQFNKLGENMVTQIHVNHFKKQLYDNECKINFQLPKVIKNFEKNNTDKEQINVNTFSIEQLEYIVDNKSKFFHGYILYGKNGERTKIANKKYKELCELKGNKPITIDNSNIKNLFYLYIRLTKQKNIYKFIKEFDNENSVTENNTTYKQIFMWFYTLINNYALQLFKIYHYAFVKKTFNKQDIPYALKPMCGDIHTLYKSNQIPITKFIIEKYLLDQTASKLYWRLFENNIDIVPIINPQNITNTVETIETIESVNATTTENIVESN